MNILVTGGAGFIGSHLVDRLLERGEEVFVIDDFNDHYDPAFKRYNIQQALKQKNYRLYEGDIRDKTLIERIFSENRIDCVCHLAARAGVRVSLKNPILYEEVNCIGTLNLLEAVRTRGIYNFVFASTSSVYGINSKLPFSEEDPISRPISPYATTKRAGELMCHTYSYLYNIPITVLRFFTVYGERGRPDMSIYKFTKHICEDKPIPLFGDGSAKRDFTYIDDTLQGVISAIYKPFRFEIINLGESRVVELRYVIELLERNLKRKVKIDYLPPEPGDVPITHADISKARGLLGYDPKVDIEEGITRFTKWYLENRVTQNPI